MLKSVARTIHSQVSGDPLGESETALAFDDHMKSLQMSDEERSKTLEVLQSWDHHPAPREEKEFEQEPETTEAVLEAPLLDE